MQSKLAGVVILLLLINGFYLYKLNSSPTPFQRFLPEAGGPGLALDTTTGEVCRTLFSSEAPYDVRDPFCIATDTQMRSGLPPEGCKDGKMMWNPEEVAKQPMPLCSLRISNSK